MTVLLRRGGAPRVVVTVAAIVLAFGCFSRAQSTSKPAASPAPPASPGTKTGFAIESEMLTYTAMDTQARAVACGIALNVGTADDKCTPRSASGPGIGVVIVSSPSSALAEFQLWRSDISTIKLLTLRADQYCPQHSKERGATAPSSFGSQILSMIPGGQALSIAQALLSTTSESNPVEGNIEDRTLVADIAGHLRSLGLLVVIPDTYMPHSLNAVDEAHSPFLTNFAALLKARNCLTSSPVQKEADHNTMPGADHGPSEGEKGPQDSDRQSIALAIDVFLKSLSDQKVSTPPSSASGAAAPTPEPVISHLSAVLRADGLAQELGSASAGGRSGENGTWYLLWLKALESGGTVAKTGNAIFGSKTNFSGGAVGTYSLFHLSGNVVCSGVFYNYAGPMQMSQIAKMLKGTADVPPAGRLAGGCAPNP